MIHINKMSLTQVVLVTLFVVISLYQCLPVIPKVVDNVTPKQKNKTNYITSWSDLHYGNYLEEISKTLNRDPAFQEHYANNSEGDKNFHRVLRKVNSTTRGLLDELKAFEVKRVVDVSNQLHKLYSHEKLDLSKLSFDKEILKQHMDSGNVNKFTEEDLKKLIKKVHEDLEQLDKIEDKKHKEHEMEKKHEQLSKIKHAKNESEIAQIRLKLQEMRKRHNIHDKLHAPGSEEQLKDVWEKRDGMSRDSFNVKTIFVLHDLNGDGFWDYVETEAIMQKELDKVYEDGNEDDDQEDRFHEMNKMRRNFFKKADKDRDSMISLKEFLDFSKTPNFKEDFGWQTDEEEEDENKVFSEEEFADYERAHHADDNVSNDDKEKEHLNVNKS